LLGETIEISRIGTDGDFQRAVAILQELDGNVDAIGLGGIDVYVYIGSRRYELRDGLKLLRTVKKTPVVDGSGLKWTLEQQVVEYLAGETGLLSPGTRVIMVSAVDRFGMARAFVNAGCEIVFGDLMFVLGLPIPLRTMGQLNFAGVVLLPLFTKLPIHLLYPTGSKQDTQDETKARKFAAYFDSSAVIAGDYHLVRRYLPLNLEGKIIVTNTTTSADLELFRERGAGYLVTTTPEFEGRSFGTNVMEGVMVALLGKQIGETTREDYLDLLQRLDFKPRVVKLN
jgi:hypothetical protein